MSGAENMEVVRRYLEEALSTGNLDLVDELLADDYVLRGPSPTDAPLDREATKRALAHLFAAFPDLRIVIHDLVTQGDAVMARYTLHGTHHGGLVLLPPLGRQVGVHGITCSRVRNGRIVEDWPEIDLLALAQQLAP